MTTPDGAARIHWIEHGEERSARWRSESGWPAPKKVVLADDTMSADAAWIRSVSTWNCVAMSVPSLG